jgi:5'-3' exoribonuclease 1
VIDDFILLAVFVGNDFLSNLPDLHIFENGLERLFEVYKKIIVEMGGYFFFLSPFSYLFSSFFSVFVFFIYLIYLILRTIFLTFYVIDGYINEAGTLNTRRLQQVLDEMAIWEREVFEREYVGHFSVYAIDVNQVIHDSFRVVLTGPQRVIFDQVKAFVLAHRSSSPSSKSQKTRRRLAMKNEFSAGERLFIGRLAEDLHLNVRWDEFAVLGSGEGDVDADAEEVNVVTWRFPGDDGEGDDGHGASNNIKNGNANASGNGAATNGDVVVDVPITVTVNGNDDGNEDEWVDEDEESRAAIDRVLGKYEKAKVLDDEGGFDERHERRVEEKMAEWKASYYQVGFAFHFRCFRGEILMWVFVVQSKLEISYKDETAMGDLVY